MNRLAELTAAAELLARAAANRTVDHRRLLRAAEQIIYEIEVAFHVSCYEILSLQGRVYTRVPGRDRVGATAAWLVNGRVILDARDRYLLLEIRMLNGADSWQAMEEINHGVSPVASNQQLQAFARDLPQILRAFRRDFPRRQLDGDLATVVMALRRAYHNAGVVLDDWPVAGETTRFTEAEREYERKLRQQGLDLTTPEATL